jgi:hypothetical protein
MSPTAATVTAPGCGAGTPPDRDDAVVDGLPHDPVAREEAACDEVAAGVGSELDVVVVAGVVMMVDGVSSVAEGCSVVSFASAGTGADARTGVAIGSDRSGRPTCQAVAPAPITEAATSRTAVRRRREGGPLLTALLPTDRP